MSTRRPMGSLEADVLRVLWAASEPLTPAVVNETLANDLAYTTVMTILGRLWNKGLVSRSKSGRAYQYTPTVTEADYLAGRMSSELARTECRNAVLSRFVDSLAPKDAAALRDVLAALEVERR